MGYGDSVGTRVPRVGGHAGGTRPVASALPLRPCGRDAPRRVRPSHYGRAGARPSPPAGGTRSRASVAPPIAATTGRGPPASPPRPWNSSAMREGRAPARPPSPLRPRRSAALPPRPPPLEFFGHAGGTRSRAEGFAITSISKSRRTLAPARMSSSVILGHL